MIKGFKYNLCAKCPERMRLIALQSKWNALGAEIDTKAKDLNKASAELKMILYAGLAIAVYENTGGTDDMKFGAAKTYLESCERVFEEYKGRGEELIKECYKRTGIELE